MRNRKVKLVKKYKELYDELLQVQKEIPEDQHITGPPIPEIFDTDFPEKNIELDIQLPEQYREQNDVEKTYIVPVIKCANITILN